MEIVKIKTDSYKGGCNMCDRGILDRFNDRQLIFPYSEIFELRFKKSTLGICEDCLYDLEEAIISARIKKDDVNVAKGEQDG